MRICGLKIDVEDAVNEALETMNCKNPEIKITAIEGVKNSVRINNNEAIITYSDKISLFAQLKFAVTRTEGTYNRKFKNLAFMADCSRNAVLNILTVKALIKHIALMGYNRLQ